MRKDTNVFEYLGKLLVLVCITALGACASTTAPPPAATTEDVGFADEYLIGVGDSLSINVWRNADLSIIFWLHADRVVSCPVSPIF